ncbi:MAG: patatin-like phospholipase family protein [Hyphomicrobiales bacterium]|nr:patatin-like phospholipase family protein [Hyphomicrobiales bacterium]
MKRVPGRPVDQTSQRFVTNCTPQQVARRGDRKPVNLALQGGGAHGAFTWGVLDRLLERDLLALDAVSATSAGAMNAVVMAAGFSEAGPERARVKLEEFWKAVSKAGAFFSPVRTNPWERWLVASHIPVPAYQSAFWYWQLMTQVWSPYQLNPTNYNPLRDILSAAVDFEHLRECPYATRLFICATNVRSGKVRIFENHELSVDAILASACLPYLFQAVEIDGETYWDGGYMGNPALFPLIYKGASRDVVVVHVNPITRDVVPRSAPEIFDRVNEISFNSSLMREMRAIAFVARLIDAEALDDSQYARMLVHSIRDDDEMMKHGVASKFDTDWAFLTGLRDAGRRAADTWLEANLSAVGERTTVDLTSVYL